MARNRGCCRRAKSALTRDCSPVRLPNWVEGYLPGNRELVTTGAPLRPSKYASASAWLQAHWCPQAEPLDPEKRQNSLKRTVGCSAVDYFLLTVLQSEFLFWTSMRP